MQEVGDANDKSELFGVHELSLPMIIEHYLCSLYVPTYQEQPKIFTCSLQRQTFVVHNITSDRHGQRLACSLNIYAVPKIGANKAA